MRNVLKEFLLFIKCYFVDSVKILSYIATIGLFFIGLYGYIYTIKPVFNKKELELKIAQLKEKEKTLLKEITQGKENIIKIKAENDDIIKNSQVAINNLNMELEEKKLDNKKLVLKYKQTETSLKKKIDEYNEKITKLSVSADKLFTKNLDLEWMMFLNIFINTLILKLKKLIFSIMFKRIWNISLLKLFILMNF